MRQRFGQELAADAGTGGVAQVRRALSRAPRRGELAKAVAFRFLTNEIEYIP